MWANLVNNSHELLRGLSDRTLKIFKARYIVTFKSPCRKEKALESYYPPEG